MSSAPVAISPLPRSRSSCSSSMSWELEEKELELESKLLFERRREEIWAELKPEPMREAIW